MLKLLKSLKRNRCFVLLAVIIICVMLLYNNRYTTDCIPWQKVSEEQLEKDHRINQLINNHLMLKLRIKQMENEYNNLMKKLTPVQ
jgi:hypothetical protein